MNLFKKIYEILNFEVTEPKLYGLFHLVCVFIIAISTIIVCKKFKDSSEKAERRIAITTWAIIAVFELYKQIICSLSLVGGEFVWDYDWWVFPFQFCSSPLYTLPLIAFLPSGKAREAIVSFFCSYTLFAGLGVCLYPATVFGETLGINIQTMVWHGSQAVLGVLFTARRFSREKRPGRNRFFLSSIPVFLVFLAIAVTLNEVVYGYLSASGADDVFNMFYISPYYETIFPVLIDIQKAAPYPVVILSYASVFTALAYAILSLEIFIIDFIKEKRKNGKQANASREV